MDYHTTYRGPEGQTTEWDDIQIKMGNKAPRPKREKAPKFEGGAEEVKDVAWVKRLDEDALSDIEDEVEDDRALKVLRCVNSVPIRHECGWNSTTCFESQSNCREQRIKELHEAKRQPLFGKLDFIRATDFRQRVTEASADRWVVVTLYKDKCAAVHVTCCVLKSMQCSTVSPSKAVTSSDMAKAVSIHLTHRSPDLD